MIESVAPLLLVAESKDQPLPPIFMAVCFIGKASPAGAALNKFWNVGAVPSASLTAAALLPSEAGAGVWTLVPPAFPPVFPPVVPPEVPPLLPDGPPELPPPEAQALKTIAQAATATQ
jgi:U5 snRNP spliceosome subunit